VLPGARGLLFRARREGQNAADFQIMVQPLPTGTARVLLRGLYARYSPTGDLVVVTADGKLLLVPFNLRKLELSGPPVALYEGLAPNPFTAAVALSNTGTLIYQTASRASSRELVWVTRDGIEARVDSAWKVDGTILSLALSPNGRSIAVELAREGKRDIWVKQLPGGPFSRITFGDTAFARPAWTADGSQLLYLGNRGDGTGIPFSRRADGVGTASRLAPTRNGYGQVIQSPDGQWLILLRVDSETPDIVGIHAGDTTLVPLVVSPANEGIAELSPDGHWLAYPSDESGTFEVYVRPFPNTSSARWQVSTAGGVAPLWSHSGKELFFRTKDNQLASVSVTTSPGFEVGPQKILFSLKPFGFTPQGQSYAISPDDKRFLMMRETAAGEAGLLVVSENWFEDVKARKQ